MVDHDRGAERDLAAVLLRHPEALDDEAIASRLVVQKVHDVFSRRVLTVAGGRERSRRRPAGLVRLRPHRDRGRGRPQEPSGDRVDPQPRRARRSGRREGRAGGSTRSPGSRRSARQHGKPPRKPSGPRTRNHSARNG